MSTRRQFLKTLPVAVAASLAAVAAPSGAGAATLDEKDPQAVKLDYKADTRKVDQAKFPRHAASQTCANCQLFQEGASPSTGSCVLFGDKQVAAAGWCSAWEQG
ncbi:high-potential iron-sulfur protein [Cupriavidus basilensis]|uniref:high-potential iron-sulfur protein n=1 Tax=Cupriavidus TaxID=106589 RepID=UPI0004494501|nr:MULTISPECIES: high-potential iron-sulfur protein [Cupriavidus]KDP87351.1 twin-arginine translocation pathway signal protein [Cupriavidus sp. SK-3]MDF3882160.1 high-potential iron-sulfur protein [Cupriavidus basilensis]